MQRFYPVAYSLQRDRIERMATQDMFAATAHLDDGREVKILFYADREDGAADAFNEVDAAMRAAALAQKGE